ncbi:hypothetical protein ACIPRD_31125 [Streptomyces sp. NPDC090108]|uniref:hypothetical protein n=1 Tax=Streptomyces sp. NPDC090108 TaxID=3365947 RepID=UPI0038198DFE
MAGQRVRGKYRKYRIMGAGIVGAGLIAGSLAVAGAFADESGDAAADGTDAAQSISCPTVQGALPEIPARAQAEVDRNLALLDKQLAEAEKRLARSQGEGGPDFVRNAILGPLESKRTATLNRIETAIGRAAEKPEGLEKLAPCTLAGAGAGAGASAGVGDTASGSPAPAGQSASAQAGAPTVDCPDVAGALPADGTPAAAQAQVSRELATLAQQITEADGRLARSQGEGGPAFVDNAILNPLESKRKAVIDRIGIDIRRAGGAEPAGLEALAACRLNS